MIIVIILAAITMFFQDILEALKDQAQARNQGNMAGFFDTLMWLCLITCTTISVKALLGHILWQKILAVVLISFANFFGQKTGVAIGARFIKPRITRGLL